MHRISKMVYDEMIQNMMLVNVAETATTGLEHLRCPCLFNVDCKFPLDDHLQLDVDVTLCHDAVELAATHKGTELPSPALSEMSSTAPSPSLTLQALLVQSYAARRAEPVAGGGAFHR